MSYLLGMMLVGIVLIGVAAWTGRALLRFAPLLTSEGREARRRSRRQLEVLRAVEQVQEIRRGLPEDSPYHIELQGYEEVLLRDWMHARNREVLARIERIRKEII